MPKFQYIALAAGGQRATGELQAASRLAALRQLQTQNLTPTSLTESNRRRQGRQAGSLKQMSQFCSGMADLLESGIPLLKALDFSIESQPSNTALQNALCQIRDDVANGTPFGEAIGEHVSQFDSLTISILAVGEEGGFLEDSFRRAAEITQRREDLKNRLVSAMTYPMFLLIIGLVVGVGLFVFFVPVFEPLFDRMRQRNELPWITSAFLGFSHALQRFWAPLLGVSFGLGLMIRAYVGTVKGSRQFSKLYFNLPGLGPVLRDLVLSRFTHVLGTLLGNGVPLLRSLALSQEAAGNDYLKWQLQDLEQEVASGRPLVEGLAKCSLVSGEISETIAIAEQANRLETALPQLSLRLDRRAQASLDQFSKLLEPMLMTLLASMIGFLIVALLMPIFTTSGRFQ